MELIIDYDEFENKVSIYINHLKLRIPVISNFEITLPPEEKKYLINVYGVYFKLELIDRDVDPKNNFYKLRIYTPSSYEEYHYYITQGNLEAALSEIIKKPDEDPISIVEENIKADIFVHIVMCHVNVEMLEELVDFSEKYPYSKEPYNIYVVIRYSESGGDTYVIRNIRLTEEVKEEMKKIILKYEHEYSTKFLFKKLEESETMYEFLEKIFY